MVTVITLLLCLLLQLTHSIDIYPDCKLSCQTKLNQTNGATLNSTLTKWESNTILVLQEPGCYCLDDFFLFTDMYNISIIGSGNTDDYIISCKNDAGLAFIRTKIFQLQNITINGCGLSGDYISHITYEISQSIVIFYHIPSSIGYGLVLADCSQVTLKNVAIINTKGIGLLGINIVGTSMFDGLVLKGNHAPLCYFESIENVTSMEAIGGGAFLLYQDYMDPDNNLFVVQLSMKDMYIYNNSYCGSFNRISASYEESVTANQIGYTVGSSGGMGISLAQLNYSVNVMITSSQFSNNTGWVSAGIYVGIFEGARSSSVNISNCEFSSNGFKGYNHRPFGVESITSGLLLFNNLHFPNETIYNLCTLGKLSDLVSVNVTDSVFTGNQAYACAAMKIHSYRSPLVTNSNQNVFRLINSTLKSNQGALGPAFCGISQEASGSHPSMIMQFVNVTVTSNNVNSFSNGIPNKLVENSGQILLVSVNFTISGNSLFINNSGVAIVAVSSVINVFDNVMFVNNKGVFGGAIRMLTQSYLVIKNHTKLMFLDNKATVQGGAIYYTSVSSNPLVERYDCFLFFGYIDLLCNFSSCPDVLNMDINVTFSGNTAGRGGTVYGSTLNSCPWYYPLNKNLNRSSNNETALQLLALINNKFFFDPPLFNATVISTNADKLTIDGYNNTSGPLKASPGQRLSLTVFAYDAFGYRASTPISSYSNNSSVISTRLGRSVYWFVSSGDDNGTSVPLEVTGFENNSARVELFSIDSYSQTVFDIQTRNCGQGFYYLESNSSCVCLKELQNYHVNCDVRSQTLIVPDNSWFGELNQQPVYATCFYDYCRPSVKNVSAYDLNNQCNTNYNRTGLVCGKCVGHTSAVFGSSRCRVCSNYGLFWIPGLAIAGIIIIFGISFLGITITEGYLNGFLFYCNCLNYLFVYLSPNYPLDHIFTPVAWVNLAIGIESCFYNGMTTLGRIGLRFVFPFYLFFLMALIVLMARKFKYFARLHFSASKTFATLILVCYFNIFGTCVEILGVAQISFLHDNVSYTGWLLDASVPYGHGLHALLIVVALVLSLVYILPLSILFLFPKPLYSWRYTCKFKPIYDAFWNPFKSKFRFWLGARALLRFVPFLLSLYVQYPKNILCMAIFTAIVWFVQERMSPMEGYWQNSFDSFFLLNLILLLVGNIYFEQLQDEYRQYPKEYKVFVYVLLCSAYIAFLAILVIHVFIRFPKLKLKIIQIYTNIIHRRKQTLTLTASINDVTSELTETSPTLENPKVVKFSELREPLLATFGTLDLDTHEVVTS